MCIPVEFAMCTKNRMFTPVLVQQLLCGHPCNFMVTPQCGHKIDRGDHEVAVVIVHARVTILFLVCEANSTRYIYTQYYSWKLLFVMGSWLLIKQQSQDQLPGSQPGRPTIQYNTYSCVICTLPETR